MEGTAYWRGFFKGLAAPYTLITPRHAGAVQDKRERLKNALAPLVQLQDGWFEGGGLAPDRDGLAEVAGLLIGSWPDALPLPAVVPTQDGNLLLEWPGKNAPSLDIDLCARTAWFHVFTEDGQDIERDFVCTEAAMPELFAFLADHVREQA